MTIRSSRQKAFACVLGAGWLFASPAAAQVWPPTQSDLASLMPGVAIKPAPKSAGWILGEWRESRLTVGQKSFELVLNWNGLDDRDWPFERIVAVLSGRLCGPVPASLPGRQVDQLYKTKSLIPKKDLGGNGGETFSQRMSTRLGACSARYFAQGARWHDLGVSVSRR